MRFEMLFHDTAKNHSMNCLFIRMYQYNNGSDLDYVDEIVYMMKASHFIKMPSKFIASQKSDSNFWLVRNEILD